MLSYGVVPSIYPPFVYFYFRPIWTHIATVEHPPIAYINPTVAHARGIIGSREKDNVAGLCLGGGNDSTLIINALRRGTGQVVDAAGRVHPADKARTVKD